MRGDAISRSLCVLLAALAAGCADEPAGTADVGIEQDFASQTQAVEAAYIGSENCSACHADQTAAWQRSHHAHSMAVADADSVLGDFNEARFDYGPYYAEFFVRDDRYWVRTNDLPRQAEPDSGPAEFEVLYTFGFEPLQQYLVETSPGNLQALNISATSGGDTSAWFDLYEGEQLAQDDPLQWSSELHSWNSRCAICHVTDYQKNYDRDNSTYQSTWAAINVGCEACHGPGSVHAAQPAIPMPVAVAIDSQWAFVDGPIASRLTDSAQSAAEQVDSCAACHSRRAQLAPHEAGVAFLDAFEPRWLTPELYHADGQILDEVFVYGSFVQSAMHSAGVACTDCHEPHSGELRAQGDALCSQCHRADVFSVTDHHRHAPDAQPECVDCHMPATTYMQVDPRRDHSFRVPRPDLTAALESPNACNNCHSDRDPGWAQESIEQWFPTGRWREAHYGEALAAGRSWSADRRPKLQQVFYDESQPAIVRATALSLLAQQFDGGVLDAIEFAVRSPLAMLQLAGLQALENADPASRIRLGQRFLDSELLTLRINAARMLIGAEAGLSERRRADFDAAMQEFARSLEYNADTAEGLLGTGLLAAQTNRIAVAESAYREAIERNPGLSAAFINLADLLRFDGREAEANDILQRAIDGPAGDDPGLYAALGLSHVRLGDTDAAVAALARAAELAPDDPYHAYTYGLALASIDSNDAAIAYFEDAIATVPGYAPILIALATMNRDAGRIDAAREYTRRLLDVSPGDPAAVALERELSLQR